MQKERKELDNLIEKSATGKMDIEKLNSIIQKIEKENTKFIEKNKEILMGLASNKKEKEEEKKSNEDSDEKSIKEDNNIEIDLEELSIANKTKNCLIKLFSCLLPFKNDLQKIKIHYNSTILITFKTYRFLVLMSFFSFLIFLYECINHALKNKDNLSEVCKYKIPCFLQYSSFQISEAEIYSVTYGGWLIFFSICSIAYYYVLNSEQKEQDSYFENNNNFLGNLYLLNSWNFNYKDEEESKKCKKAIKDQLKEYKKDFIDLLDDNKDKTNCLCTIIINFIYIIFILVYFALFFIPFLLRDLIRNKENLSKTLEAKDILADIVAFIIIIVLFHVFNKFTDFFARCEGWRYERYKYISNVAKNIITSFVGIFALLFINTYFTLYTNNLVEKFPFLGSTSSTFFGCPGKYEDHRHTYHEFTETILENDYQKIEANSYSKCREEEVGIGFFILFLLYFISTLIIDLFKNCFNCLCNLKPAFEPLKSMIIVFTNYILYLIAMFYIPYLAIIFPFITIILYKFQYYLLNHKGSYSFEENGLFKRNNAKYLLFFFLLFIIELIGIQGYFYFLSFPHYYQVNCYIPNEGKGDNSILLYNYDKKWCGPIKSYVRLSDIFTELVKDTPVLGYFINFMEEIPFIISLLALILIIIIYKNNNPDMRYNEYIKKKKRDLDKSFRLYYEQVSNRDNLSNLLLKVVK